MLEWQQDFTVIAPDYPGYGLSDSLGSDADKLEDFADSIAEFADAIGITSAGVYGFHTGAGMAIALADRHPYLVSAAYANGFVVLTPDELDHILSEYLPALVPQWDGSHLNWIWNRNRDQLIFFPWFDRRLSARMKYDMPEPEVFQKWLIEFLRAGDNYRIAYKAAFCYAGEKALARLTVPAIVTATATDVLRDHLDKITAVAATVDVHHGGTLQDNLAEAREHFKTYPGENVIPVAAAVTTENLIANGIVAYEYGNLRIRFQIRGSGQPILLIHGAARSSTCILPVMRALSAHRPVIAIDLPGHGESDSWPHDVAFIDAALVAIRAIVDEFSLNSFDAWGEWGGASLLCEFVKCQPGRITNLVIAGAQAFSTAEQQDLVANYAPEILPRWHGGHLQELWHRVRNETLFWPWYQQGGENVLNAEPQLDPDELTDRVLAQLQSAAVQTQVHRELIAYPLADNLVDIPANVLLTAASWDPLIEHTRQLAERIQKIDFVLLPNQIADWPNVLLDFYAGE